MSVKKCFKCGKIKSIDMFYAHPKMADGHVNKCKDCNKKDVKTNWTKKSQNEEVLLKERERGIKKYHKFKYISNSRKPNKSILKNLRRDFGGDLNINENMEIHHWNYNMPYSVFLMSKRLHKRIHSKMKLDENTWTYYTDKEYLDSVEKHHEHIVNVSIEFNLDLEVKHYNLKT